MVADKIENLLAGFGYCELDMLYVFDEIYRLAEG
jgi:hypothetical protein